VRRTQCPDRMLFHPWNRDGRPPEVRAHSNEYAFLSENAARWLVGKSVRLIAMDTPSPDNPAHSRGTPKDSPNHKVLLGAGVVMVEYVTNLKALTASEVELIVMPLKLKGCDGSPARCVAIEK
jgi:arylformamidase